MASIVRAPTVFVGTAKSVTVAPYGPSRNDFCGNAPLQASSAMTQRLGASGSAD